MLSLQGQRHRSQKVRLLQTVVNPFLVSTQCLAAVIYHVSVVASSLVFNRSECNEIVFEK